VYPVFVCANLLPALSAYLKDQITKVMLHPFNSFVSLTRSIIDIELLNYKANWANQPSSDTEDRWLTQNV